MGRVARGLGRALGRHPWAFLAGAGGVAALNVLLPPLVLSLFRKPADFATLNPWLRRLPEYVASDTPLDEKLGKLSRLALGWVSADSPMGGVEWSYALDVADVGRILLIAGLFGAWAALWLERRRRGGVTGGVAGALVGTLGLSTGPCSVMGCGAPVLPVVGLAFTGLSSSTLAWLGRASTVATTAVLGGAALAVLWLAWCVGAPDREVAEPTACEVAEPTDGVAER